MSRRSPGHKRYRRQKLLKDVFILNLDDLISDSDSDEGFLANQVILNPSNGFVPLCEIKNGPNDAQECQRILNRDNVLRIAFKDHPDLLLEYGL